MKKKKTATRKPCGGHVKTYRFCAVKLMTVILEYSYKILARTRI